MDPKIDLSDSNRKELVEILNALLADEHVLYTKTRNYHWNVTGPHFNDLHKFFESQYDQLAVAIDDVAERARALGGKAEATFADFTRRTRLKEHPGTYPSATDMVANLLADHETVIRQLRKDLETCAGKLGDAGTSDFLTGLMEAHEKTAWMLRSTLEG